MDVLSYVLGKKYTDELKGKVTKYLVAAKEPQRPIGHTKQVSGYGCVDIPSNAKGQVSVTAKGLTATNIINNGNFANGTSGWQGTNATISVSNNIMQVVSDGSANMGWLVQNTSYSIFPSRKYFIKAKLRVTNNDCVRMLALIRSTGGSGDSIYTITAPVANQWYSLAIILDSQATHAGNFRLLFAHEYADAATANGKIMEVQEVMVIDLIAHGLESKTVEELAKMFANYFDGTKSTISAFRIRSVSEDESQESVVYVLAKDDEGNIEELRSLPNGVKDEIRVSEGKLIKRVSDWITLDGNERWIVGTSINGWETLGETVPFYSYDSSIGTTNKQRNGSVYSPDFSCYKAGEAALIVTRGDREGFSIGYTDYVAIRIAKSKLTGYSDELSSDEKIALFKQWLSQNPIRLIYQLAVPVVTKVDVVGELVAYPHGTIWAEPCIWGFMTEQKKVVTTPDLPIQEVRKVIRYDISENGKLIETDVTADVTVGDNNTSLTIANFERGKVYFYDCSFAQEVTTQAEIVADVEVDNGVVTHDYGASAADWVLDSNESKATMLVCTNAGGAAKIIAPATEGKMYIVKNNSGQTITIKTASSTGVMVANGKTATVVYYDTDFIKLSEV